MTNRSDHVKIVFGADDENECVDAVRERLSERADVVSVRGGPRVAVDGTGGR